jgi:hypothetical protein
MCLQDIRFVIRWLPLYIVSFNVKKGLRWAHTASTYSYFIFFYKHTDISFPWDITWQQMWWKNFMFCWPCISIQPFVIKTNLMHYLFSVYFVNQPLHVLGIFVAHHQELYCINTTHTNCCIYTEYLLMMGYRYARNIQRLIDEINWGKIVHQVGFHYKRVMKRYCVFCEVRN